MRNRKLLFILLLLIFSLVGCRDFIRKGVKQKLSDEEKLEFIQNMEISALETLYFSGDVDMANTSTTENLKIKGKTDVFVDVSDTNKPILFTYMNLHFSSNYEQANEDGKISGIAYIPDENCYADLKLDIKTDGTTKSIAIKEVAEIPTLKYEMFLIQLQEILGLIKKGLEIDSENTIDLPFNMDSFKQIIDKITIYKLGKIRTLEIALDNDDLSTLFNEEIGFADAQVTDDSTAIINIRIKNNNIIEMDSVVNLECSYHDEFYDYTTFTWKKKLYEMQLYQKMNIKVNKGRPKMPKESALSGYTRVDKFSIFDFF